MKKLFFISILLFALKSKAQDTIVVQSEHAGSFTTILANGTAGEDTYTESSYTTPDGGTVVTLVNNSSSERKSTASKNETLHFSIYPNPTSGIFTISAFGTSLQKVEVFSVLGELTRSSEVKDIKVTLDISTFPKGIYFVRAFSVNGEVRTEKLVYR